MAVVFVVSRFKSHKKNTREKDGPMVVFLSVSFSEEPKKGCRAKNDSHPMKPNEKGSMLLECPIRLNRVSEPFISL